MNVIIPDTSADAGLTEREKQILRSIVHLYILKALPIGSRLLAKYLEKEMKLSPATVRNVMADLEEMELISHPHTSAGRIPTDKGYRYYVDSLMQIQELSEREINAVNESLTQGVNEQVFRQASQLLGYLSRYLGIVEIPHLKDLCVQKIELIYLSSSNILVVLALDSNIIRTVTLDAHFNIEPKLLESITLFINEKISGKTLSFIRENFRELIAGSDFSTAPVIRLFVDSIDNLFSSSRRNERIHIAGTQNLLSYPEFVDLERVKGVIELIENEDIIIHILDKFEREAGDLKVLIGKEMQNELLEDYSLIVTTYRIGTAHASVGLIGPKRMNYSKMVSLVQFVSEILSGKQG